MARELDQFPVYDPISTNDGYMTPMWSSFMATFFENLTDYFGQYGMFIPVLTTAQRDSIDTAVAGQMIYNTSMNQFQGYNGTTWKTFTIT